ncbi:MAG TPA: response regulator, partial [Coleofasciculaceae cyanobacterium]
LRPNRIVVIAMTASDLKQDQERAIEVGMDDFVGKPVRRDTLAIVLERWSQVILASRTGCSPTCDSLTLPAAAGINPEVLPLHLDLENLHLLSDHSSEFELELLRMFTQDCQVHLESLYEAIAANDLSQVEQCAHYMKGASANIGAKIIEGVAAQLERQAHQKQLEMTDALLAELNSSLQQIQGFIKYQCAQR